MATLKFFRILVIAASFISWCNAILKGQLGMGFKPTGSEIVDAHYTGDFYEPGTVHISGELDEFANKYNQTGFVYAVMKNGAPVKLELGVGVSGRIALDAQKQLRDTTYEISGVFPMGFNTPSEEQAINFSLQCMGTFSHPNTVTITVVLASGFSQTHVMAAIMTERAIDVIMEDGSSVPLKWVRYGKTANSFVYSVVDIPR